jgi:hypothetical protein
LASYLLTKVMLSTVGYVVTSLITVVDLSPTSCHVLATRPDHRQRSSGDADHLIGRAGVVDDHVASHAVLLEKGDFAR